MRLVVAVLAALVVAGCGGDSSSDRSATSTAQADRPATTGPDPETLRSATAYARRMQPIAGDLARILRGADLTRNRRDFDRGVALLRARKQMARITADPALLLAHDRLAKAVARAGTLLVAAPGSEVARGARQAGIPPGTQTAALLVGRELDAWAGETGAKLTSAGATPPPWLQRARSTARARAARASRALS